MSKTPFIITIDTEGDNFWARPREITTHNAAYCRASSHLRGIQVQAGLPDEL